MRDSAAENPITIASHPRFRGGLWCLARSPRIVCVMPSLPEDLVILAVGAKPRGGPNNGKLPWRFCIIDS
jgi:hypothetical protein